MTNPLPGNSSRPRRSAPDPAWIVRGACAGYPDPDLWFESDNGELRQRRAIAICGTCPVKAPCLDFAMSVPGLPGIWGATTRNMRTRLRDQAARRAPGTA
jgi:WhiB family transcriptional regulator, redox-sensing transcriptional regulator